MKLIFVFLSALPDIIRLLRAIQAGLNGAATDRHVAGDLKTIHEALNANDPEKLNALFANRPLPASPGVPGNAEKTAINKL